MGFHLKIALPLLSYCPVVTQGWEIMEFKGMTVKDTLCTSRSHNHQIYSDFPALLVVFSHMNY